MYVGRGEGMRNARGEMVERWRDGGVASFWFPFGCYGLSTQGRLCFRVGAGAAVIAANQKAADRGAGGMSEHLFRGRGGGGGGNETLLNRRRPPSPTPSACVARHVRLRQREHGVRNSPGHETPPPRIHAEFLVFGDFWSDKVQSPCTLERRPFRSERRCRLVGPQHAHNT